MKQELLPENLADFRRRFGSFHDAVIHEVKVDLFSKTKPYNASVTIGTQDIQQPSKTGYTWVNLTLDIENVSRLAIRRENSYIISIIFRLLIYFYEDKVFLDFTADKTDVTNSKDIDEGFSQTNAAFAIIGEKCFWYTSLYRERG